jgi:monofunctional biosynthetic peptidoglycan transglycosylase
MKLAVVASEDNNFMHHSGFDWGAIEKARAYNASHPKGKLRGASTISQQTAKNVFLWPARSWLRKGLEVYFTFLIELFWPKERIMEVYLNVIETGLCKFGVEAASRDYFGISASALTRDQAALIAGCLPKPRTMNPGKPSSYLRKRQGQIARLMRLIGDDYFKSYQVDSQEEKTKKEKRREQEILKLNPDDLPQPQDTDEEENAVPSEVEENQQQENSQPDNVPDSTSKP